MTSSHPFRVGFCWYNTRKSTLKTAKEVFMPIISGKDLDFGHFAGGGYHGWNEAWGYPQISKLIALVGPEDLVLDLGAGTGRASFPLALAGGKVLAVDTNPDFLDLCDQNFASAGLSDQLEIIRADVFYFIEHTKLKFRFVLASDLITHFTKTTGMDFVSHLPQLISPGGIIFISAPSTLSWSYDEFRRYHEKVDIETYLDLCDCSGELKEEPVAFYNPGELEMTALDAHGHVLTGETHANDTGNYNWVVIARF